MGPIGKSALLNMAIRQQVQTSWFWVMTVVVDSEQYMHLLPADLREVGVLTEPLALSGFWER